MIYKYKIKAGRGIGGIYDEQTVEVDVEELVETIQANIGEETETNINIFDNESMIYSSERKVIRKLLNIIRNNPATKYTINRLEIHNTGKYPVSIIVTAPGNCVTIRSSF